MAGRLARYNWGSGINRSLRATDVNDADRRELISRDLRDFRRLAH